MYGFLFSNLINRLEKLFFWFNYWEKNSIKTSEKDDKLENQVILY